MFAEQFLNSARSDWLLVRIASNWRCACVAQPLKKTAAATSTTQEALRSQGMFFSHALRRLRAKRPGARLILVRFRNKNIFGSGMQSRTTECYRQPFASAWSGEADRGRDIAKVRAIEHCPNRT